MQLGAGRSKKTDQIDHAAGIYLNKEYGEQVREDEVIITLYTNKSVESSW
ncbi:Pyrimidine-nucleoside phosphorylase, partial [Mycoplasma putrefaciens]